MTRKPKTFKTSPSRAVLPPTGAARTRVAVTHREGEVSFGFDARGLPRPLQVLTVSYAEARRCADGFQWLFSKAHPLTSKATFLVEVMLPTRMFVDILWPTIHGDFLTNLAKHCAAEHAGWRFDPISGLDTAPFHTRRASVATIAYTGGEAEIDFHLISTADLSFAVQGQAAEVTVEPVVKVLLAAPLLNKLLQESAALVEPRENG